MTSRGAPRWHRSGHADETEFWSQHFQPMISTADSAHIRVGDLGRDPWPTTVGGARQGVLVDHEAFYAAVLTTSPFISLTVSDGVVFGPLPAAGRHRAWNLQRWVLINGLAAAVLIFAAAVYSMLVLAGVIGSSFTVRNLVVSAVALSLLLVLLRVAYDIVSAHITDGATYSGEQGDIASAPTDTPLRPSAGVRPRP